MPKPADHLRQRLHLPGAGIGASPFAYRDRRVQPHHRPQRQPDHDAGHQDQRRQAYLFDEENRLSCTNKGPQTPSPSCSCQGATQFIYDHGGTRKVKSASRPTIYPNQYYTDFGGGTGGNQFKHIFIGPERILTKKARIAPDRQHWYYHPDHLGSTAVVTNERASLADAIHYFPLGEVWLEERPSSLPADYFFSAKEFDPETGFYNFGARYLDPRFSKWMTTDPALGDYLAGKAGGFSLVERLSERLGSRKARKAIKFLERLRKEPGDAIERGE